MIVNKYRRHNTVGLAALPFCPGTICANWDSQRPEWLTDKRTGNLIGRLMPRLNVGAPVSALDCVEGELLGYQRQS